MLSLGSVVTSALVGLVTWVVMRNLADFAPTAGLLAMALAVVTMILKGVLRAIPSDDDAADRRDRAPSATVPSTAAKSSMPTQTPKRLQGEPIARYLTNPASVREQRLNIERFAERRRQAQNANMLGGLVFAAAFIILLSGSTWLGNPVATFLLLTIGAFVVAGIGDAKLCCPHCRAARPDGDSDDKSYKAWNRGQCPACGWLLTEAALEEELARLPSRTA